MSSRSSKTESLRSKQEVLDFSPKGYLIRYPFLVDLCVKRFIDDFQDDFKAMEDGTFKLKKIIPAKTLKELFATYLDETISSVLSKACCGLPPSKNDWIIIADSGSCRRAFYEMVEKDIDIGLKKIENVCNSLFNRSMKKRRGDERIVWCKHRALLSDDWVQICKKKIFGSKNVVLIDGKLKAIKEVAVSDEKINPLLFSKEEQGLIVKEAVEWILAAKL